MPTSPTTAALPVSAFLAITLLATLVAAPRLAQGEPLPGPNSERTERSSDESQPSSSAAPTQVVDFTDEEGFGVGETMTIRDPEEVEHESLLPERYRREVSTTTEIAARVETDSKANWRRDRLSTGVTLGLSRAGLTGDSGTDSDRFGGFISAFLAYRLSPRLALQPEIQLVARGALAHGSDQSTRLTYVAIPFFLRFEQPVGGISLVAKAGPSLGVATSSQPDAIDGGPAMTRLERLDLSGAVATGIALDAGSRTFELELRYEHSIGEAARLQSAGSTSALRNRSLALGLGVRF